MLHRKDLKKRDMTERRTNVGHLM